MGDRLDYQAFYDLLTELVAGKGTHTVYGRTEGNRSVIIGLRDGEIVCMNCGAKRGGAAVPALRQMTGGTFRVEDELVSLHSTGLPATAEIMAALSPFADLNAFRDPGGAGDAPPGVGAATGMAGATLAEAKLLCNLLSRFIGPVAPVVCSDEIAAAGGIGEAAQIDRVLGRLAGEIGDAREAEEFKMLARRELEALRPAAATLRPQSDDAAGAGLDTTALAEALCGIVSDYLGPVAPILCEEKIAAVGGLGGRQQLEAVIQNLALEIGERGEAQQFVTRARAQLRLGGR